MDDKNKLIITVKNPKSMAKSITNDLRKMFLPYSTYKLDDKHPSITKYKQIADTYKFTHFIVVGNNFIKIAERKDGPTYTFFIEDYDPSMAEIHQSFYQEDALITLSGECEYRKLFEGLTNKPKSPLRSIHFYFKDDIIKIRHYQIKYTDEFEIKVSIAEIGPRYTLKFNKKEEGFFETP